MNSYDTMHIVYLVLLGTAVLFWFITNHRQSLGKTMQQVLAWVLIFLGAIAAYGMWDDIRSTARPGAAAITTAETIEVRREADGHFHLVAQVNGASVRFIVDTGASEVVLTREDAERAGLDPDNLPFFGRARTANGDVPIAPVTLDELRVGALVERNVRASVNGSEMHQSLLGMSYLSRFSEVTISGNKLVLSR